MDRIAANKSLRRRAGLRAGRAAAAVMAAGVAFGACGEGVAQCPISFASPVAYGLGGATRPTFVAIDDVNGDGRSDLVLANINTNNVSVLLAVAPSEPGTFQPAVNYGVGAGPWAVAIGDVNGDGRRDIVAANGGQDSVSVLTGNGDGSFKPAVNYSTGGSPVSVAVGDLNGDGRPDLVTANSVGFGVSVLINSGLPNPGTYLPAVNYTAGRSPVSVSIGDVNNDGRADLAVVNNGDDTLANVSVLLGNGAPNLGTFQAPVNTDVGAGSHPQGGTLGDVNGDGRLDMVVARGTGDIAVLMARAVSPPGAFVVAATYAIGGSPRWVAIGDLNADGRSDLVVAKGFFDNFAIAVLQASGNGSFLPAVDYGPVTAPFAVAIGDVNGDGRPDLVAPSYGTNEAAVLFNTSSSIGNSQQPGDKVVAPGQTAAFSVVATGSGPLAYQWRRNGAPLSESPRFSGVNTPVLLIASASAAESGAYDVRVAGGCNGTIGVVSNPAALCVTASSACPADFNHSGTVSVQDLFDFLAAMFTGCP